MPCSFCCCNQTTHPPACVCPQPAGVLYRAGRGHCPQPAGKGTCHPPGPALKRGRRAAGKRRSDCSRLLLQRGEERRGAGASNFTLPTCTLPAGLGTARQASIFPARVPWGSPGASAQRPPAPARHGEPEHRPEEESLGAALQGGGDDCWRAAEVGGDGALLPAASGLYPASRRLKALSSSKRFPSRCCCLPSPAAAGAFPTRQTSGETDPFPYRLVLPLLPGRLLPPPSRCHGTGRWV